MRINLTTPMSDDKERQRRNEAMLDAIERYTDERMAVDYVCEPADDSRSGGQPLIANRKAHTMIIEVLAAWGIEPSNTTPEQLTIATTEALCRAIKQLEDLRQPTHRNVVVAAAPADRIGGAGVVAHGVVSVTKDPAAEWQAGYEAGVEAAVKVLKADARLCDCAALEVRECACGAWYDYKSITSARAVEIVRKLADTQ